MPAPASATATAATTTRRRTVRVHAAERSTDQDLLRPYLGTIAWLVAAAAVLAAAWVAAAPAATADLPTASTAADRVAPVSATRTATSTDDVVQPDPFARPVAAAASTAVTVAAATPAPAPAL